MTDSTPSADVPRTALLITGTDTGVGKTIVAAALVRRLRALDQLAAGVKPVETGCTYGEDHDMIAADGASLHAECPWVPPMVVAPYRFAQPIAPAVAAEVSGAILQVGDLADAVRAAHRYADRLIVEGAGGALTPIAEDGVVLDLAGALEAPVLILAKDTLGTQSQTLAVLEAARARGLTIAGVMLVRHSDDDALDAQQNRSVIEKFGEVRVFETAPFAAEDPITAMATHLEQHGIDTALA